MPSARDCLRERAIEATPARSGHLRCRKQRRRRHRCGTPRQRQRFRGRRIAERPAIEESRKRVGDWEGDTIVGKGLSRVVTLVDRKSGLLRMRRVPNGEAGTVRIPHTTASFRCFLQPRCTS